MQKASKKKIFKKELNPRSTRPVGASLDVLDGKQTLLILRNIVFAGKPTYGQFLQSAEKIATNILANRLAMLEAQGLLTKAVAADSKSKVTYRLTEKGVAAVPILIELTWWGAGYCATVVNAELLLEIQDNKDAAVAKCQQLAREQAFA